MDVHEYAPYGETYKQYGYRHNNDEELGVNTNINIDEKSEQCRRKFICLILKNILKIETFHILNTVPEDHRKLTTLDTVRLI